MISDVWRTAIVKEIASRLDGGYIVEYHDFMRYLRDTKQYFIRCLVMENRYLFGSFVKEAQQIISK